MNICELEERIHKMRQEANCSQDNDNKMSKIITSIQYLVSNLFLSQDKATNILAAIEKKSMSIDEAFVLLQALVKEKATS